MAGMDAAGVIAADTATVAGTATAADTATVADTAIVAAMVADIEAALLPGPLTAVDPVADIAAAV